MATETSVYKEIGMTERVPERSEIEERFRWNAESVFANEADWDAEFHELTATLQRAETFRGRLGASPQDLIAWLEFNQELTRRLGRLRVYAGFTRSVDMQDQRAAARDSRLNDLQARHRAAIAFAEPEILDLDPDMLGSWLADTPELAVYRHYFDGLERRRQHVRSAEVEELLGQVGAPFGTTRTIHAILSDADLKFAPATDASGHDVEISQGTINALITSPDPELRRTAYERYGDAYLAFRNTAAACLEAGVKQDVFRARAGRYSSSLEAALAPAFIPDEVFHNLIATYRANVPTWHRYWNLRRQALGGERLPIHSSRAALTANPPRIPYLQAVDWICEGMRPLGNAYVEAMRRGVLEERWVDVYPNRGKRMGAFSSGSPGTHPFIFMSYNDDIFSLSTLAHELGHSMHSYYSFRNQPTIYARYGLFLAEVASNFNQALVRAHLLASQPDRDLEIALLEEAMANFYRYFFVMPTLARFELEIHERVERGEALTATSLMTLMADLFREGYGPAVAMDEERVGIVWAQFSTHLYSNFYVYQYATGISGAHALANRVLNEGTSAAERYLTMLKAGGSVYPLDALSLAGVDLASPKPVEETFAVMASYVDRLEALLGNG
jgi:oligoendopeptidase F